MFKVDNRHIGLDNEPYIIAELSANHNGSLQRAKLSIKAAKECGVDAIKLQTYTPNTMTIDCDSSDFIIKEGLWAGYKLYDLYREAHTPYEWHAELFKYAAEVGVTIFSTPFDESAVDLLESLGAPAYKVASFELTDLSLISYIAKTRKPIFMSTGMASESEISAAVETARMNGSSSLLLFHCVSSYPAPVEQANIKKILNLKEKFGVLVGLSDHTVGNTCAIASVALGACAIEKHFTVSRKEKGPDSEFSAEPEELKELVVEVKRAWSALGVKSFDRPSVEDGSKAFRRSIYFVSDLKAGHIITSADVKRIRPGFGISPSYFESILGMTVVCDVRRGEAVSWDKLKR